MIIVTHNGTIGEIAYVLPICSWLEKNRGQKIIFVFPDTHIEAGWLANLLKIQKFTHSIEFDNLENFNPNKMLPNTHITERYDFEGGLTDAENLTDFYARKYNLGVDRDFVLNLDLEFKQEFNNISITPGLNEIFPNYRVIYDHIDILASLREFAYSKERHVNFDYIATYLGLAKIPFYLYLFRRINDYYSTDSIENFWIKLKDASILDVRSFDENRNITSIYNKIYFKQ